MSPLPSCPVCNEDVCLPTGPKGSPFLLIRSEVNEKEPHTRPFNDRTGNILRKEMYDLGMSIVDYRQAVLWNHNLSEGCDDYCEFLINSELKDKKLIILVGAGAVTYFTDGLYAVDDVKGLDISDEISTKFLELVDFDTHWYAIESPGVSYVKGVGELQLSLQIIQKYIQENLK